MPRHRRLDINGAIYHVISRGWNRMALFKDPPDRVEFLHRLEKGLSQTGCRCYAWVLMTNHFHLLLSPQAVPLSTLMRKVQTGYALYFNRRHHRTGYLFQNRYKSILCEKDDYWLELIRYIHLNPVRAGIIRTLEELNKYPWSGHAVLVGKAQHAWQAQTEVLRYFAAARGKAQMRYCRFIQEGWEMGRKEKLTGGGLMRSAGGWEEVRKARNGGEFQRGDERILGSSEFVEAVLSQSRESLTPQAKYRQVGWDLDRLVQEICTRFCLNPEKIRQRGRQAPWRRREA